MLSLPDQVMIYMGGHISGAHYNPAGLQSTTNTITTSTTLTAPIAAIANLLVLSCDALFYLASLMTCRFVSKRKERKKRIRLTVTTSTL